MDWSQVTNNPTVLGAAGGALVLLIVVWLVVRRRKNAGAPSELLTPQDVISQMGSYCPPFSALMESYTTEHRLGDFLKNSEASSAFDVLQEFLQQRIGSVASRKKDALQIHFQDEGALDADVKGALVTIARCVYADEEYQGGLDSEDQRQFDRLLDFLT